MKSRDRLRLSNACLLGDARHASVRAERAPRRPRLEALESRQLLSGAQNFQFGGPYTTPVAGYSLVAATAYSASLGYGWQSPYIYDNGSGVSNPSPLLTANNKG